MKHTAQYPRILQLTLTRKITVGGVLKEVPDTKQFKTAKKAAFWYADNRTNVFWHDDNQMHNFPIEKFYNYRDKVYNRVLPIFKKHLP